MIKLIPFAVRDAAGVVIRTGRCQPVCFEAQAIAPGETVAVGTPADFVANAARLKALVEQAQSFRQLAEPSEEAVILQALATKVGLTPADLIAAREKQKPNSEKSLRTNT